MCLKSLIKNILTPLIGGIIVGLISRIGNNYSMLIKPFFAPPGYIFPIVWTILYILMGISFYLTNEDDSVKGIYYLQLIVNLLWSIIFFNLKLYFIAFLWIILLIVLVVIMIRRMHRVNNISAYLNIPYLLWLILALVLNFSIYLLN